MADPVVRGATAGTATAAATGDRRPSGKWACAGSPIPPGNHSTTYMSTGCGGVGAWYTVRA
ncbi:hypothetical protein ABZ752_09065 [Streptomyces roseifaciens]